jgi:hypothetical protein
VHLPEAQAHAPVERIGRSALIHGVKRNVARPRPAYETPSPLLGVLQDHTTPMIIDNPPFFDLFQGAKAAEAGEFIV